MKGCIIVSSWHLMYLKNDVIRLTKNKLWANSCTLKTELKFKCLFNFKKKTYQTNRIGSFKSSQGRYKFQLFCKFCQHMFYRTYNKKIKQKSKIGKVTKCVPIIIFCSSSKMNVLGFQGRFKAISVELTSAGRSFSLKWPRGNCESIFH